MWKMFLVDAFRSRPLLTALKLRRRHRHLQRIRYQPGSCCSRFSRNWRPRRDQSRIPKPRLIGYCGTETSSSGGLDRRGMNGRPEDLPPATRRMASDPAPPLFTTAVIAHHTTSSPVNCHGLRLLTAIHLRGSTARALPRGFQRGRRGGRARATKRCERNFRSTNGPRCR